MINGLPTNLTLLHESTGEGNEIESITDQEVPVSQGDRIAFMLEEAGGWCYYGAGTCPTHYSISVSFD